MTETDAASTQAAYGAAAFTGPASAEPRASGSKSHPQQVFFHRRELNAILGVYGRMVAAGEWRDYAIGGGKDAAVFAVYRRTSEMPLYRIEKRPKLARRQGAFAVIGAGGVILKRGHDIAQVLRVFDRRKFRVVES